MRSALTLLAALATGVTVFFGLTWLLVFLVLDVFAIGISSADFRSLVLLVILRLVPLICALLAAVFVAQRLRRKRDDRGFEVISQDRNGGGAA
jgi:hypothetical protein